jgi:ATP-binding protein involved in chromosome partitioning
MRKIRTYNEVAHETGSRILEQVLDQRSRLQERPSSVRAIVAVVSGKGGVGKSAITANVAAVLATRGARVGALDADLNGPSLGRMLGVAGQALVDREDGVEPAVGAAGVRVMSMDLLQEDDAPLRWRGPGGDGFVWRGVAETGVLREFLSDVAWRELDYLLVDVPPGTDRISRLLDLVPQPHQILLVTTPAEISRFVVAKSARMLRDAGVDGVGIVANMTAYMDPAGGTKPLFAAGGALALASETGLELLAEVPFDPELGTSTDHGRPFVLERPDSPAAHAIETLADRIERGKGGRFSP